MSLQTIAAFEHFAAYLTGNCRLFLNPLTVGLSHMCFENFFCCTEMSAFITYFRKVCVMIKHMLLKNIGHCKLFATIITFKSTMMVFLHVLFILNNRVVS